MSLEDHAERLIQAAQRHALPIDLARAIVRVESGGNPWAVRYEPAFWERYVAPKPVRARAPCSEQTESRLRACSFGLMQIMGATARDAGFDGVFLTELCDPNTNIEYGCRYLAKLARQHHDRHGWEGVAAAFNAGSPRKTSTGIWANQPYIDKIRAAGGLR